MSGDKERLMAEILTREVMKEQEGRNLGPVQKEHGGYGPQGGSVPTTNPDGYLEGRE